MQSDPASAHDELVERMVSAMLDADNALPHSGPDFAAYARAALAVASPVIREECARVADDQAKVFRDEAHDQKIWGDTAMSKRALAIANYFEKHAAAIRAME